MKTLWVTLFCASFVLAACGANAGEPVPAATLANPPALGTPTEAPVVPADTASPTSVPAQGTPSATDQKAAQQAAIANLAKGLGIPAAQVTVDSMEAVVWPNGCMGVQRLGVMCTMNKVPGFRVILSAKGVQYEEHTNQDGSVIAPEQPAQAPAAAEKVAVHQLANNLGIWIAPSRLSIPR